MGKILIIKGADFSAVAVGKEIVEPTEFITIVGFGPGGYTSYEEGDVYYRCQAGKDNEQANLDIGNQGFYKRIESTSSKIEYDDGTIVKMDNLYYTVENSKIINPYYGLKKVAIEIEEGKGYSFIDTSSEPSIVTDSRAKSAIVSLIKGKTYKIYTYGSSTRLITNAIVNQGGEWVNLGGNNAINYITYTPQEDNEVLYISNMTASLGVTPWVAVVD